jgi:hypothetical protein
MLWDGPTAKSTAKGGKMRGLEGTHSRRFFMNLLCVGSASTAAQALYNVLQGFFAETSAADQYCETSGPVPLNYLNIYYPDFTYADRPSSDSETSVATGCGNMMVTFQGELSTANTQLLSQTSEP